MYIIEDPQKDYKETSQLNQEKAVRGYKLLKVRTNEGYS